MPSGSVALNYESLSSYRTAATHAEYVAAFVRRSVHRGVIGSDEVDELSAHLTSPPGPEGSGLDALQYEQFLATTAQLIEICLHHSETKRPGFVNGVVQLAMDSRAERGWKLVEITDEDRRGGDRRKTFGQVKERPCDPMDPSFFGGSWIIERGDERRRLIFAIEAESVSGVTHVEPAVDSGRPPAWVESMVRSRGPAHWELQVEADSPLGAWITKLAGTDKIGQLRDQIPLGVLSEAVKRAMKPHGLSHLLLGPSRRDCPVRRWHTGRFLTRQGDSYRFRWEGFAFDPDDVLVRATTVIEVKARIVSELSFTT